MVAMAFLAFAFPSGALAIQDLAEHDERMQDSACGGILFPFSQHVHDFERGIMVQDLVEGTQFDPESSLLAMRRLETLNWAVGGCLGWYHFEFWTAVVRGVPVYRRHGLELQTSNPVCRAGVTTWTMERIFEKLEGARKRPVIRILPVVCEFEENDRVNARARALLPV